MTNFKKIAFIALGASLLCVGNSFTMDKGSEEKEKYEFFSYGLPLEFNSIEERLTNNYSVLLFRDFKKPSMMSLKTFQKVGRDNESTEIRFISIPLVKENRTLVRRYKVTTVTPCFVILKEGKVIATEWGTMSQEKLEEWVEKHTTIN